MNIKIYGFATRFNLPGEPVRSRLIQIPEGEIVEIEDDLMGEMLELAYKYGQNDFQRRECPSLSAGDVVQITIENGADFTTKTTFWRVMYSGWKELPFLDLDTVREEADRASRNVGE